MGKAATWHSASESEWALALRREAVIRPLAERESLTPTTVLEAAQVLNLSRSVTYDLIARYRRRPQTSTLLVGRKGRKENSRFLGAQIESVIQNAIHQFYLTRERPRIVDLIRDIRITCEQKGLKPPNFRSVRRRLESLDPKLVMEKREGGKAARLNFRPVGASTRGHLQPLEVIQIDHTPVDVIVVDERDRLPIGRPWLSLAIDLATRTVPGLYVSLDPPSAISVALVLSHAVLPKDGWLADRELRVSWPVAGIPEIIHLDNAQEFQSEALVRGAAEYGIRLEYRPARTATFWGPY
jgi:putative transposase